VAVATNGRIFSYPDFAKRAADSGLTDVVFSVHGNTPGLHDSLTGVAGSFAQAMSGMENVLALFRGTKNTVGTNTAVTRPNYSSLPETGAMIMHRFGIVNSEFIFADPSQGGVLHDFTGLMPKISECAPYMRKCLELGKKNFGGDIVSNLLGNWAARYVPLCHFTEYYPFQISEIREQIVYSNIQHVIPGSLNLNYPKMRRELTRVKTAKCSGCALASDCEGIWKKYVEIYGDSELKPVSDGKIRGEKLRFIKEFLMLCS